VDCPIGIGRDLTAPPSHTTGHTGHVSGGSADSVRAICTPTGVSSPSVPAVCSSQRPSIPRPLAGCHRAAPPQAATPLDRSGLQHARAGLLCRLLTSARRSGRITPSSVPCGDTLQISRGKLSYLPCISARFIKHSPLWMEDFTVACPLVPTVPHLISGSCPSPRTFVPRFLQTPPRGDALALPLSFGSTHTWTGDFHPRA
jgi:hypothetical protein